ncbi:MAG: 1,2-phenylacetyl-CoA epoxidase subunit B [Bacteroidota bacterium]|nr:1,2-phenylacetyl-CoA epoxidase subunit B [Bacteroidota bacterium]
MKILSLDPRVSRMTEAEEETNLGPNDSWHTYEVFHQKKRGAHHQHVGILHAPNPQMALVFAKEQFARRGQTTNLWVVKSSEILATDYDDADIFETTPEKLHREAVSYKVRDKIETFKKDEHNA